MFIFVRWVIIMFLLSSAAFFQKITDSKKNRVSNGLDPDQDRRSVGPDLDQICLQMLSIDASKVRVTI